MRMILAVAVAIGVFFASSLSHAKLRLPDHALLDAKHVQASEKYIQEKFKKDGVFNLEKAVAFKKFLLAERKKILADVYQTKLIENLELKVRTYDKARREANEASAEDSRYAKAHDRYLLPLIDELIDGIIAGRDSQALDGIACDFVRGYLAFHVPNPFVTIFPLDLDVLNMAFHVYFPRTYKKSDNKKVEANNLTVDATNVAQITGCLGTRQVGSFLTEGDLMALKQCQFDISTLNPGVSPLWEKVAPDGYDNLQLENLSEFPKENQELLFKSVIFRGQASPKIKVEFINEKGEAKHLKLKFSNEVHIDRTVSKLFQFIGLNQDSMLYRSQVKVNLGDLPYEKFASQLSNKYSLAALAKIVHSRSKDSEKPGWVVFKDVLFEAKPHSEMRLGPVDFGSWDLQNRREFRSVFLAWAWVALIDTKMPNYRMSYISDKFGNIKPQARLQDTGYAFGTSIFLKKWRNVFAFDRQYLVNEFATECVYGNSKKDEVRVLWNDFAARSRQTDSATWSDLKWMARQIGAVPEKQIYRALIDSGMPEPVALVYHLKLMHRRNGMISAFGLEEEIPLFNVPKLEDFNPYPEDENPPVKNGRVIKKAFEDKVAIYHLQQNWATFITNLASYDVDVYNHVDYGSGQSTTVGVKGLQGLKADLNFVSDPSKKTLAKIPLAVGVYALLTRKVQPNSQVAHLNGKAHLFKIVDTVQIRFDVESPLFKTLLNQVPGLAMDLSLKFYEKKFEHIHHSDRANEAFTSPFRLHRILLNMAKYAAYEMQPLETIQHFHRFGIELQCGIGAYSAKPIFTNEVSVLAGSKKVLSCYYLRDEYGRLHVFKDKLTNAALGFNLDVATLDLFDAMIPFFRIKVGNSAFHLKTTDVLFDFDTLEKQTSLAYLTAERRDQEYDALKALEHHRDLSAFPFVKQNYSFESEGSNKVRALGALFVFNLDQQKNESTVNIVTPSGGRRYFYRLATMQSNALGLNNFSLGIQNSDIFVKNRKRTTVTTEMDLDDPKNFILAIRSEDFYRAKNTEELFALLGDLNRRYSKTPEEAFYPPEQFPTENLDELFRKIYGLTRVFLDGGKLIEHFHNADRAMLKAAIVKHFAGKAQTTGHISDLPIGMRSQAKAVLDDCMQVKEQIAQLESTDERLELAKKIAKEMHRIAHKLDTQVWGLVFFKELLGEEGMYVMGDVAGVHGNSSTMQDLQEQQRRRFAAQAWGTYYREPPVQKFLRFERLLPPSSLITKLMRDQDAFGALEMGIAPNLIFTYDHNRWF